MIKFGDYANKIKIRLHNVSVYAPITNDPRTYTEKATKIRKTALNEKETKIPKKEEHYDQLTMSDSNNFKHIPKKWNLP